VTAADFLQLLPTLQDPLVAVGRRSYALTEVRILDLLILSASAETAARPAGGLPAGGLGAG
jgi:hypothetical protein